MIILLCVDASIFASLAFAHIHLSMALDICPPPGAALPASGWAWGSGAALVAGSVACAWAVRLFDKAAQVKLMLAMAAAVAFVLLSFSLDLAGHMRAGLQPHSTAWGASVAALLGWQGLHVVVLLVMGGYVLVRTASGRLRLDARATIDNTVVMWHYVTAQGVVAMLLVRLLAQPA
jgi:cytochrome c oxidase subunit I+III